MSWKTVAMGAVVGIAGIKLVLSRGEATHGHGAHAHAPVTFAAGQRCVLRCLQRSAGDGMAVS